MKVDDLAHAGCGVGLTPPSTMSRADWAEANIELDNTSQIQGKLCLDITPTVRWFLDATQRPGVERVTGQISAQSGKTLAMIILLLHIAAEDPGPTMWVGATKENVEEFGQKRLFPAMEQCRKTSLLLPKEKGKRSKRLIQLASMNLILRGTESRIGLQSDPVRYTLCDERREWRPGAIDLLRKRTLTYYAAMEIGIGTAGRKGDELDRDFLEGTQTHAHFRCRKCCHSQPFRFGRQESPYHPKARARGGIVWDTNETTKPGGKWDYEEVKKTVRYECEECGEHYRTADKLEMIRTLHPVDYNPNPDPKFVSFNWNALAMPWKKASFENICVEFLRARQAWKAGNREPMIAFITETLGEPFEDVANRVAKNDLLNRMGAYKKGECVMDEKDPAKLQEGSGLILTFDRQNLDRLEYVIRQWWLTGRSRLIWEGTASGLEEMRQIQIEKRILDRMVGGDDHGPNSREFRQRCMAWGWMPLFGEDRNWFVIQSADPEGNRKSYNAGWQKTQLDPGYGTVNQNERYSIPALKWSGRWFKDSLYHHFIRGAGPEWLIPTDVSDQYLKEVNGNELQEVTENGIIKKKWAERGRVDKADAELMQLVMADYHNLTRAIPVDTGEKKE